MITNAGRRLIQQVLRSSMLSLGWSTYPYISGPDTDPTDADPSDYTDAGPFDEGTTQAISPTLPPVMPDPSVMPLGTTTWTLSSGATIPQTVTGMLLIGYNPSTGIPVLVGAKPFLAAVVLSAVGQQMIVTEQYLAGLLAP